ncbi:hypothetical protein DSO57_1003975 [Entomophthora muscae]|uniref:Uncharacterized protein n=1 Tax=Entomophthora muscae TaxID=34485 RepID=A0ACC2TVW8_9FUNG|nr:hypothetical protein DSO57_1003975 [Entomophthora muscae]
MDIYSALESIGFPELVSPLKEYLDIQKENARAKKANISEIPSHESMAEHATVEHMEEWRGPI